MADISPRRKFAGRALLAGAALALPLTASITYAESGAVQAAQAPAASAASPAAPVAPVAPQTGAGWNENDGEPASDAAERDAEDANPEVRSHVLRIERRAGGEAGEVPVHQRILRLKDSPLTAEERAELEADMAALRKELAEDGALGQAVARARAALPDIVHSCQPGQTEVVVNGKSEGGREAMFICQSAALDKARASMLGARSAMRGARAAVEGARRAVQADPSLSEPERSEALRALDEALAELPAEG